MNAGGDNRNPHDALKLFIKGGTKDDNCIRVYFLADPVGRFIHLKQGHIEATGHIDQYRAGTFHRGVIQQWVVDRRFRRLRGAGLT